MEYREHLDKLRIAASQKAKERAYWIDKLSGELQKSSFPYDYKITGTGERSFATVDLKLAKKISAILAKLSTGSDVRLYIILTAGLILLLHKYTGNKDIVIGTPILQADREVEFINTVLTLRNQIDEEITFKDLILQVKQTVVEAGENRNYPIEVLMEQLGITFSGNDSPLFDVAVLVKNIHDESHLKYFNLNMIISFLRKDGYIAGQVGYNSLFYDRMTIKRIVSHFKNLLDTVVTDIDISISEIDILSEEERRQILYEFNDTAVEYPKNKTIHRLFAEQVEMTPDKIAAAFEDNRLIYRELHTRADRLAILLIRKGIKKGAAVGIMIERSLEMVIGLIGILKTGGAYLPIDPEYPVERKRYMLGDSNTRFLLTSRSLKEEVEKLSSLQVEKIFIEDCRGEPCVRPSKYSSASQLLNLSTSQPLSSSMGLAYIIYTSGSTGRPKGVMVDHRSIVRLVKNTNYIEFREDDSILQTGALEFDASTFEIWGSLLNGLTLFLAVKDDILNADKLEQVIRRYKVSTIWLTSPLFNYLSLLNPGIFAGLRNLLVGGDVLSPFHINRVRSKYPHLGIINGYGPTENTTFSTTFLITGEYEDSIPIGQPIANSMVYIVDKANKLLPVGVPGELYVGGDGVARGYMNNAEFSEEKFAPNPFSPGGRLYRTGDLCRWLVGGNIEFLGRIDQQVKIRGFRIELSEIESQILNHENIKEAVVIAKEYEFGDKFLCAYFEAYDGGNVTSLREYLGKKLPDYMIPSYFIRLDKIPLTANGKIDRRALPEPEISSAGKDYAAPRNEIEAALVKIWSDVLNIEKQSTIGINDNFFELGGHSLKATIALAKIHKLFNVRMPLKELFRTPTVRLLAEYIEGTKKEEYASIEPAEEREYYRLSSAQKRLYLLQQIELANTGYNLPCFLVLTGKLDMERFAHTFKQMIERHESLRTSFRVIEEEPVQQVHSARGLKFEIEDYDIGSFIRPFDLSCAPLLRVALIEREKEDYILMLDMHHIISDGTSMEIFVNEFVALYSGEELPALKLQYRDYSRWQQGSRERELVAKQEAFWLAEYQDEIPVLGLPTDYPRPQMQSFAGNRINFSLSREATESLQQLARTQEVTLYMMLVAVINVLLSKLSSQEDLVIGTVIAGRRHVDLENIIGMFVNTLTLRNNPSPGKIFTGFLSEVKERTLKVFENQEYQFEDLVERVAVNRDTGRNPLFDVMFVLQNMGQTNIEIPGLKIESYEQNNRLAKFDLTFAAGELDGILTFSLEYCTKLFKQETIERFIQYFKVIIESIIKYPPVELGEIEVISAEEKKQILNEFNNKETGYHRDKPIQGLFAEQAEKTPDNISLVGAKFSVLEKNRKTSPLHPIHLTYRELNDSAGRLAYYLYRRGINENDLIAIMVDRSIEMIIGILGILKAGGCYVPLNIKAPISRNRYIMDECEIKILLTREEIQLRATVEEEVEYIKPENNDLDDIALMAGLPEPEEEVKKFRSFEVNKVFVEESRGEPCVRPSKYSSTSPPLHLSTSKPLNSPMGLAYVIFTSGSTGKPKGVPITHANLCPLLHWGYRNLGFAAGDHFIQNLSYYFDWSVWEIFMALTSGSSLYMINEEILLNPEAQVEFFRKNDITVLHITPTQCLYLVNSGYKLETLKYLIIGAEKLTYDLVERSCELISEDCRIFNMYGPTEATIMSAVLEISRQGIDEKYKRLSSIPIGEPIANLNLLILDKSLKICPVNITGELYVAGDGVASGYLNDMEKSVSSFIRNIYAFAGVLGERLYKTGDLVRWLADGNIEFLGRVDQQVKIRGNRIELGEIEKQLLEHNDIKEGVVIARGNEAGEKYLCAYIIPQGAPVAQDSGTIHELPAGDEPKVGEIREYLARTLPDYMIPSYFVKLNKLPLSANGKIDIKVLPIPDLGVGLEDSRPRDKMESSLASIWSEVLGIDMDKIGIDSSFFELGGHSLKATRMTTRLQKELSVRVPLKEVFANPTIRRLSTYIKGEVSEDFRSICAVEKKDYYVVSSAQKRLYLLHQFEEGSIGYNMPSQLKIEGKLLAEDFARVFRDLIWRHEGLRSGFEVLAEEPVQRVYDAGEVEFAIENYYLGISDGKEGAMYSASEIDEIIKEFIRPFDLSQPPLFRAGVIELKKDEYIMMLDMHHIISDGSSIDILVREFMELYKGGSLLDLRIQYKDYSEWERVRAAEGVMKAQEEYWAREFSGEIPVLDVPTDYSRPQMQSFAGSRINFSITGAEAESLQQLARAEEATLYMMLVAVTNILLYKLTGQEDIVIGTVTAGRRHADLEPAMGMFVNTLALRNYPAGEKTIIEFIREVKNRTLKAQENQEYQFEDLVEKVEVKRDASRNPLFDVMLVLQNVDISQADVPGLKFSPYDYSSRIAKFDMTFICVELERGLNFTIEYSTTLFKKETIKRFANYYKTIVSFVANEPGRKISQIKILPEEERKQIFAEFNHGIEAYPPKTVVDLFAEQVAKIPGNIACFENESYLTYKVLNKRTDVVAKILKEL